MRQKAKVQVYLPPETVEAWKACAEREGVNLSDWVSGKVLQARLISETLKNVHTKLDTLLARTESQ